MDKTHSMPPKIVLGKSVAMLKKLAIVMRYQSENFDSESVESFGENEQLVYARISHLLSNAAVECQQAMEHIDEAHKLLQ